MAFATIHTTVGCNRRPHCLDFGQNNRVVYGACNAIVVFKIEESSSIRVEHTLVAHKKLVTSVRWIFKEEGTDVTELLSTSVDGTAIIWSLDENNKFYPNVLSGHESAVQTADAVYSGDKSTDLLLVTASTDSTVRIWTRVNAESNCIQTLSFGHGFATELKLTFLEEEPNCKIPILAVAVDDFKICLYCQSVNDKQFILAVKLSGPEDWIHGLDFMKENGYLLLASGAQDRCIRLWKIKKEDNSEESCSTLKLQENIFKAGSCTYSVMLESLFMGHSDWIYSVKWHRSTSSGPLLLLSASMDKSVILWSLDPLSQLWLEKAMLGDIGGTILGFFGAVISPCGKYIVAHGYQGAIDVWFYNDKSCYWERKPSLGGHFGPVQDISWEPEGAYVLSCSMDQTTRLYAPWGEAKSYSDHPSPCNWSEIARPQIHGYDMVCLSVLNRFSFVSGADEKILRVFNAPRSFAQNLKDLCNIETSDYMLDSLPEGASVPSLGLSNKAVYDKDIENAKKEKNKPKHVKDQFPNFSYVPVPLTVPPTEDLLLQNTLWPEDQKLYGHPYEVFAVAANHQGSMIASACKASKVEHAAIILWDVHTLSKITCLEFHALTVTQLEFSPDDEYLLSVSRDRTWAVYQRRPDQKQPYIKVANLEKKSAVHSRIIWSCSWSHDSLYFATSSRDKKLAVWGRNTDQHFTLASAPLEVKDSATAVSFAPCTNGGRYIIAVGLENGQIFVYSWEKECSSTTWSLHITIDKNAAHHLTVNRLKFSPRVMQCDDQEENKKLLLASCGSDNFLRIYHLELSAIK